MQTFRLVDGVLQHVSEVATPAGTGPRHVVFGRDGRTLYVIGELSGTIMVFPYDPYTGQLGLLLAALAARRSAPGQDLSS